MGIIAKSVVFDIEDNWGGGAYDFTEIRSIEFYRKHTLVLMSTGFTAYATTVYSTTFPARAAFDTSFSKIGVHNDRAWVSTDITASQRLIIVFDTPIEFDKIVVNNGHDSGNYTENGAQNVVITSSTDEITHTVYGATVTNATVLFDGILTEHPASNTEDDQISYLDVIDNRVNILVDHSKIDSDLVDFPVLVNLGTESGITNHDTRRIAEELEVLKTTFDPSAKGSDNLVLSNGNKVATHGDNFAYKTVRGTESFSSGRWYYELEITDFISHAYIGVCGRSADLTVVLGSTPIEWAYVINTGNKYNANINTAYGNPVTTDGDVVGVAFDVDAGKIWFSLNGVWQNSGDPEAGTGFAFDNIIGDVYPAVCLYNINTVVTLQTAEAELSYTPPVGFALTENSNDKRISFEIRNTGEECYAEIENWDNNGIMGIYPSEFSDTTVVTDSTNQATLEAWRAVNPDYQITGTSSSRSWLSGSGTSTTPHRVNIDYTSSFIAIQLYLENYHNSGGTTTYGVKDFKLYGTNETSAFTETDPLVLTDLTLLGTYTATEHPASDVNDPQYFDIDNAVSYQYYTIIISESLGGPYIGIRHIEFQGDVSPEISMHVKVPNVSSSVGTSLNLHYGIYRALGSAGDDYTKFMLQSHTVDGSVLFEDSSPSKHIITPSGNTHHEVDQKKFGKSSIYFDAVDSELSCPISSDWDFGTGTFTIDFWLYNETGLQYQTICSSGYISAGGWLIQLNNQSIYFATGGITPLVAHLLTVDTWYHIAFVFDGTDLKLYVDGTEEDTFAFSTNLTGGYTLHFGNRASDNTWDYKGYLDDFRISKGIARWTGNFTPPVIPNAPYIGDIGSFTSYNVWDINYVAVYHMAQDPSGGTDCILDSTINANHGTPAGTMLSEDLVEGLYGKALEFDDTDDYISVADDDSLDMTSGITLEAFIYPSAITNHGILQKGSLDSSHGKYTLLTANSDYYFRLNESVSGPGQLTGGTPNTTSWQYHVGTYDQVTQKLIVDGSLVIADSDTSPIVTNTEPLIIGSYHSTTYCFGGKIGEVRLSNVARSEDWIRATKYSLSGDLLTYSENGFAGWDPDKKIQLTVAASDIGSDLTDFPVLVNLGTESGKSSYDASALFEDIGNALTTFNPDDKDVNYTLSVNNTVATKTLTTWSTIRCTESVASGKWYFEFVYTTDTHAVHFGVATKDASLTSHMTISGFGWAYADSGDAWGDATHKAYGDAWGAGDVIGVALDLDTNKIWFSKNGVWQNSGDPVAGTGFAYDNLRATSNSVEPVFPAISMYGSGSVTTIQFLSDALSYSAPTGFSLLPFGSNKSIAFEVGDTGVQCYGEIERWSSEELDTQNFPDTPSITTTLATSNYDTNYYPHFSTDPTKGITGTRIGNSWLSGSTVVTDQKFNIDYGVSILAKKILIANGHHLGGQTNQGVKNVIVYGTNTSAAFNNTTYSNIDNLVELGTFEVEEHLNSNVPDYRVYDISTNTTAYRYYVLRIADNWGDGSGIMIRRISFLTVDYPIAQLHVKVPFVSSSIDTILNLWYDSTQADNTAYIGDTGDAPAQKVWEASFVAVYHLAQDPSGGTDCILDSTVNINHGTPVGTIDADDLIDADIGKAINFDGTSYIECGDDVSLDDMQTLEISYYNLTGTSSTYGGTVARYVGNLDRWNSIIYDTYPVPYFTDTLAAATTYPITDDYGIEEWHIQGYTNTGTEQKIYRDGTLENTDTDTCAVGTANGGILYIGGYWYNTYITEMAGALSEVRISSVVRSADWIATTNLSLTDSLFTFLLPPTEAMPGWDPDKKIKLTIAASDVASDLTDFPILINLGDDIGKSGYDASALFADLPYKTSTFDPLANFDWVLSGYNKIATYDHTGGWRTVRCTKSFYTGKWYFEFEYTDYTANGVFVGVMSVHNSLTGYPGLNLDSWGFLTESGEKYNNDVNTAYGDAATTDGDVIGIALDMDAGKIWWSINGVWQDSGSPAGGTGFAFDNVTGEVYPAISAYGLTTVVTLQFDEADLSYLPPTGFSPIPTGTDKKIAFEVGDTGVQCPAEIENWEPEHYVPKYPAIINGASVNVDSYFDSGNLDYMCIEPSLSLVGTLVNTSWLSANGSSTTPHRVNVDYGVAFISTRLYLENCHHSGALTTRGINNFKLYGTNEATAFTETGPTVLTDLTLLGTYQADEHPAVDIGDPQYFSISNTSSYRYYTLIADDTHGDSYMSIRHMEFQQFVDPTAQLHVKVPFISSTEDTVLNLWYNSAQDDNTDYIGDTGDAPAQTVWDSIVDNIFLLAQDPSGTAPQILDSTSNEIDLTTAGTMLTEDLVDSDFGKAIEFDGVDDVAVSSGNSNILNPTSGFTMLVKFKTITTASYGRIVELDDGNVAIYMGASGEGLYIGSSGVNSAYANADVNDGEEHTVVALFPDNTQGNARLFLDGEEQTRTLLNAGTVSLAAGPIRLGDRPASDRPFAGTIGDVRVYDELKSDDWIASTNLSLTDALITYALGEDTGGAIPVFVRTSLFQVYDFTKLLAIAFLDQPYWLQTLIRNYVNQTWSLRLVTTLIQTYGAVDVVRAKLVQWLLGAQRATNYLEILYGSYTEVRGQNAQLYSLIAQLVQSLNQPYTISQGVPVNYLEQEYAIKSIEEVLNLMSQTYNLNPDPIVPAIVIETGADIGVSSGVDTQGIPVYVGGDGQGGTGINGSAAGGGGGFMSLTGVNIEYLLTSYAGSCTLNLAYYGDWALVEPRQPVTLVFGAQEYKMVVVGKARQESHKAETLSVECKSPAVLLDFPFATEVPDVPDVALGLPGFEISGTESQIVNDLAALEGLSVVWEIPVDDTLTVNEIQVAGKSPLAGIREIVNALGGVIQSHPDGTIHAVPKYIVNSHEYAAATLAGTYTSGTDFINLSDNFDKRDGFNKYSVSNMDLADGYTLDTEEISPRHFKVSAFKVPWTTQAVKLTTSELTNVTISATTIISSPIRERIEIVEGAGKLSKPFYGMFSSPDYESSTNLGTLTIKEDGTVSSATAGNTLVIVTYRTKYWLWDCIGDDEEEVQFILTKDTTNPSIRTIVSDVVDDKTED